MKELARNIIRDVAVRFVSRYGVLSDQEVVTLGDLPKRGITFSDMDIPHTRLRPGKGRFEGLFVVSEREPGGRYTLQNSTSRIVVFGVPRSSIRKIIEQEER